MATTPCGHIRPNTRTGQRWFKCTRRRGHAGPHADTVTSTAPRFWDDDGNPADPIVTITKLHIAQAVELLDRTDLTLVPGYGDGPHEDIRLSYFVGLLLGCAGLEGPERAHLAAHPALIRTARRVLEDLDRMLAQRKARP